MQVGGGSVGVDACVDPVIAVAATSFSIFFQLFQILCQLINVLVGQGVGLGQCGDEAAGAAAKKAVPHTFALGGQVVTARQGGGVTVPSPLLFAGDAAFFF